jgi:hypothetical protein
MVRIPRVDRGSSDLADFRIFADEKKMKEDETDLRAGFGSWRELTWRDRFLHYGGKCAVFDRNDRFPGSTYSEIARYPRHDRALHAMTA